MNLQDSLSEERLADGSNDDSENLSTAASTIHQKVDATIEAQEKMTDQHNMRTYRYILIK